MNNIDKLVELISKRDYPDKESLIQRLKAISSQFDDKFKYTTDFIVELNDLLAQEEKFSDDEIQFLIKFSSIPRQSSKEYLFDMLTEKEKSIFDCIDDKVLRSISFYNEKRDNEVNVNDLLEKLKYKGKKLIDGNEIDFIVKIVRENFDKNDLIEILKEINKINMGIFRRYGFDSHDYDISEEELEITNLNSDDIIKLLSNYGIDFSSFDHDFKKKLIKYGNLDNMKDILDFLKKEKVLTLKNVLIPDILVRTLLYSNLKSLEYIKSKNNIDFVELVKKMPTVLYPTTKEKIKNEGFASGTWKTARSGSMTNYIKNSDLLNGIGISPDEILNKCYSFFIQNYKTNKASIDALKSYGISIMKDNGYPRQIFSVLGYRNPSIIDMYDLALESDAKEYALKASSALVGFQKFKFLLIKLARKRGIADSGIFCHYTTPKKEISLNVKRLYDYLKISNDDEISSEYGAICINIPNKKIYDNIFDISDLNIISSNLLEDDVIKSLEKFAESEELYNFNGVKISRKKVLRRYLALKNNGKADSMSALMYCITYGSLLDKKEFNNIYSLINENVNLKWDGNIYAFSPQKNNVKTLSGGPKYD